MAICGRWADIEVWDLVKGDIVRKVWDASDADLDEIEEQYSDEPGIEIVVVER